LSGSQSGNYTLTQPSLTADITPKRLTITANNSSKQVGGTSTFGSGSTAFTSSGLVVGETIGSVTLAASGGTASGDVAGSYTLTPSAATGGTFSPSNYSITYVAGTFTVTGSSLVTPTLSWSGNLQRVYGDSGLTLPVARMGQLLFPAPSVSPRIIHLCSVQRLVAERPLA